MNDINLIERSKQGDRDAFDELYQKYKRPILNYIYRFIGNRSQAEDLTHEVFIRAYVNISKFKPFGKFSSWLYRIAGNLAKNHLRHASYDKRASTITRQTYEGQQELSPVDMLEDKKASPHEAALSREYKALIQDAINNLAPSLKEAVILCDIQGFSYEEAAKVMRCRPMTVGSRLWRGRKNLTKQLKYIKNGDAKR